MSKPKNYVTRVERVEAMKITEANARAIAHWSGGRYVSETKSSDPTDVYICVVFPTLNGNIRASINSWVVKNLDDGTFDHMTEEEFSAKYHEAGVRSEPPFTASGGVRRGEGLFGADQLFPKNDPPASGSSVNIQMSKPSGPPYPNTVADQIARETRQRRTRDDYRR